MKSEEGARGSGGPLAGKLALIALLLCGTCIDAAIASAAKGTSVATYTARGSVEQAQVTGAGPGQRLKLVDRKGEVVAAKRAGSLGGIVFRHVPAGGGYRVKQSGGVQSPSFRVLSRRSAPPNTDIYDQALPAGGYGYLTTRDGTKLAINVHLPGPADQGPYPTLVEYSGYGYADPAGGESSIAPIADILGFAVVDVNMRGTGCSGGAFDYFEPLQGLDGYDVIETVARQPWTLNHKVGMMGDLLWRHQPAVRRRHPPARPRGDRPALGDRQHPDDALSGRHSQHRLRPAMGRGPCPRRGARVADRRPEVGARPDQRRRRDLQGEPGAAPGGRQPDREGRAKQLLPPEGRGPARPDHLRRQDQTCPCSSPASGPTSRPAAIARRLPSHFTGTKRKWFTFANGVHADSLDPATFNRWYDFLELYVAGRQPRLSPAQKAVAPTLYGSVLGVPGVNLPDDPIQDQPDYASALAAFERQPPVRILFDNGAAGPQPGAPLAGFEQSFSRFPPAGTRAKSFYLASGGALSSRKPAKAGAESFIWDKNARPPTSFSGDTGSGPGGLWTATPGYDWTQSPAGHAVSYVSSPLGADTAVIGAGAVKAWVRSSAPNVDLQVTVSEVRPDNKETFVQNGWLRASGRKLDAQKSTPLEPVLSLRKSDAAPLPKGRWAKVTVPLYYQGHAYRSGSRIRVTIAAPGGDQPVWAFGEAKPAGTTRVALAHSPEMPSRLVLPVVPGVAIPSGLPPCPGLRGEPCRDYVPFANRELRRR